MRHMTATPIVSTFLFCCASCVTFAAWAQTKTPIDAPMATIISPIDTTSLKGRMASAEKAAQERTTTQIAAEATDQTPRAAVKASSKPAPVRAKSTRIKSAKSITPIKRPTAPVAAQAPMVIRGDEFSYRHRGMLKDHADGENRYGGSTFALSSETLTLEYADAIAGFISFDNLGTLREQKIYRANGSAEVRTYDQRSGNVISSTTESISASDALTAGGISVKQGVSFGALLSESSKSATPDSAEDESLDEKALDDTL